MNGRSDSNPSLISRGTSDEDKEDLWQCRHTIGLLGFLGMTSIYGMRINLSVAIVAMVGKNVTTYENSSSQNDDLACPLPEDSSAEEIYQEGDFDWDEKEQGMVLGSFYWGYFFTNILGGMAAERYGPRLVMGLGVLISALLSMFSPLAAGVSSGFFIGVRTLEGIVEGGVFPAMNCLLSSWIIPEERAMYSGIIYAGVHFGTVVTLALSGVMCDSTFLGGWPSVFYVFGGLALVWSAFWFVLIRDSPQQHPRISQQELKKLQPITLFKAEGSQSVPWRSIFSSVPFWSVAIVNFGSNWGFYTILADIPTYFDQIQHVNVASNGLFSALPQLITWITSVVLSQLMTYMNKHRKISLLNVRRISMVIAGYVPMLGLIGMCFVKCDKVWAVIVLCISVGASGAIYSGCMCSHMDIAPRFAGTLMGITNTFGSIPGFVSPLIVGAMTQDNQSLVAWRNIFVISSLMYGVSTSFFLFTATVDVQSWNFYGTEVYKRSIHGAQGGKDLKTGDKSEQIEARGPQDSQASTANNKF